MYGSKFRFDCSHDIWKPGFSNNSINSIFEIVPNPATSQITILTKEPVVQKSTISIADAAGIIYYRKQMLAQGKVGSIPIDIIGLKPGLYFVRIEDSKGINVKSFVKK